MAVVYLLLLVINFKKFRPRKTLLLYWFGFYALSLLVSAIFGVDFRRAFWSNFERMTGVFVVWHFIAYAIMVSIVFDTWPKIKRVLNVLLAVSLLQALVVAAQYTKEGVYLYSNIGGRVWGTLGNSIYIGSYFLFHIFFALLLAFKEKKQIWQIIYLSIAILEAFIILYSRSSRGADIAVLFGILTIIFGYAIFAKTKNIRRVGIGVLLAGIIILGFFIVFKNTETVKNIPVIGSVVNISLEEGTGKTRAIAWEIAWQTFKERPISGIGLENFYYTFNKHYNPESLLHSYYETWFDRSHSILFDTLSMGGIIGFLAYFGLYAVGGASLFVAWRRKLFDKTKKSILIGQDTEVGQHVVIFFFIIFSIYIIQNLFVFEHPASYLLIYFSFGLLLALLSGKRENAEPKYEFSYSAFFAIAGLLLVLFFILLFGTTIKTYKAATGIIRAESIFVKNYKVGLDAYKEILSMKTPFIFDMRSSMIKRMARVNDNILTTNPDYKSALLFAREKLLEQIEEGGKDVYDYLLLGQIDTLLASVEPKYLNSAEDFFTKASELSPKRQQIYYTWAKTKLMKGDALGAE
ncbi:O-antigen ligase family protein, partial [Patescibacteria group bacterium]|nr:O-antigen ligase family protein [Patescibacteria group bacterium]